MAGGRTDSERLDFLQERLEEGRYTRRAMVRWSRSGRGLRLYETSQPEASGSVRDAIDRAMDGGMEPDSWA